MFNSHVTERVLFRSYVFDDFKMSKYNGTGLSNIFEAKQGKKDEN